MNLSEKLKKSTEQKVNDRAKEFAKECEPELIKAAKKGYSGLRIDLSEREDAHILRSDLFIKELQSLLVGCAVSIDEQKYRNNLLRYTFTKEYLLINW